MDLKFSGIQANASLAQLVKHWTLKPAVIYCIRLSPTGGNLFSVGKSFDVNSAFSANFVLTVKNSIASNPVLGSDFYGKVKLPT